MGNLLSFRPCERCGNGRQWLAAGKTVCMICWDAHEGRALIDVAKLDADHRWVDALEKRSGQPLSTADVERLALIWARLTADSCTALDSEMYPDWEPAQTYTATFAAVERIAGAAGLGSLHREDGWQHSYYRDDAVGSGVQA